MTTFLNKYITTHYPQWVEYAAYHVRHSRLPIVPAEVVNDVLCTLLERDMAKLERLMNTRNKDGTELDFFVMRIIKIAYTRRGRRSATSGGSIARIGLKTAFEHSWPQLRISIRKMPICRFGRCSIRCWYRNCQSVFSHGGSSRGSHSRSGRGRKVRNFYTTLLILSLIHI